MNNTLTKKKKGLFKGYSKMERQGWPFAFAILFLPVIQIAVFYFYVTGSSFFLGFQDAQTGNFSFENFRLVLNSFKNNADFFDASAQVTTMLGKSVFIWVVGLAFMPLGWISTCLLTRYMPGSNFFRAMYTIPGIVGTVVFSTLMKEFYYPDGLITKILLDFGADLPLNAINDGLLGSKDTAFWTLLIQTQLFGLSGGNMIYAGAIMRVPNELYESASLDGCGLLREVFQITIPCIWSTVSTMMIFSFCGFFTSDLSFYVYSNGTGNFGLQSMGYYLYKMRVNIAQDGTRSLINYTYFSAFGMCITFITIPMVLFGRWLMGKINENVDY